MMLSHRQEVRSKVKWPRPQTRVKGELRLTALVAAFERMLMPILHSFTFGNANVTINPKKKKKNLHHNRTFSSVHLPGHIWSHFLKWWTRAHVPRRRTRASAQPRLEARSA